MDWSLEPERQTSSLSLSSPRRTPWKIKVRWWEGSSWDGSDTRPGTVRRAVGVPTDSELYEGLVEKSGIADPNSTSYNVGRIAGPFLIPTGAVGAGAKLGETGAIVATEKIAPKLADEAAEVGVKGFGNLSQARNYGIWPYRTLKADLRGTGLDAHHLYEQRFAGVLGQSAGEMASVAVTKAEHQVFTNAWRRAIPYGEGTANATPAQIKDTARQIYADYPDILTALGLP